MNENNIRTFLQHLSRKDLSPMKVKKIQNFKDKINDSIKSSNINGKSSSNCKDKNI